MPFVNMTPHYTLETYSERDGLWHVRGKFSSAAKARRYADTLTDCYIRITSDEFGTPNDS